MSEATDRMAAAKQKVVELSAAMAKEEDPLKADQLLTEIYEVNDEYGHDVSLAMWESLDAETEEDEGPLVKTKHGGPGPHDTGTPQSIHGTPGGAEDLPERGGKETAEQRADRRKRKLEDMTPEARERFRKKEKERVRKWREEKEKSWDQLRRQMFDPTETNIKPKEVARSFDLHFVETLHHTSEEGLEKDLSDPVILGQKLRAIKNIQGRMTEWHDRWYAVAGTSSPEDFTTALIKVGRIQEFLQVLDADGSLYPGDYPLMLEDMAWLHGNLQSAMEDLDINNLKESSYGKLQTDLAEATGEYGFGDSQKDAIPVTGESESYGDADEVRALFALIPRSHLSPRVLQSVEIHDKAYENDFLIYMLSGRPTRTAATTKKGRGLQEWETGPGRIDTYQDEDAPSLMDYADRVGHMTHEMGHAWGYGYLGHPHPMDILKRAQDSGRKTRDVMFENEKASYDYIEACQDDSAPILEKVDDDVRKRVTSSEYDAGKSPLPNDWIAHRFRKAFSLPPKTPESGTVSGGRRHEPAREILGVSVYGAARWKDHGGINEDFAESYAMFLYGDQEFKYHMPNRYAWFKKHIKMDMKQAENPQTKTLIRYSRRPLGARHTLGRANPETSYI